VDSFEGLAGQSPVLLDEQIIRFCGKSGVVCLPVIDTRGHKLGVIVIGVDQGEFLLLRGVLEMLQQFLQLCGDALQRDVPKDDEINNDRNDHGASNLQVKKLVHEANNALSIIKTYFKVLDMKTKKQDFKLPEIAYIDTEIDRVGFLMEKIRNPSSEFTAHPGACDVNELLKEQVKMMTKIYALQTSIDFHLQIEAGHSHVPVDRESLKQVFNNLIKNAVESMPEGGRIRIISRNAGGGQPDRPWSSLSDSRYIEVFISDQGQGIPREIENDVLKPLVSSKNPGHSGLGLSVASDIVNSAGGWLTFEKNDAVGTTFRVKLPLSSA